MSSRREQTEELRKRCEAVGWRVRLTRNGRYHVKTHNGETFTFGSQSTHSGDHRAQANSLKLAESLGLLTLEEKLNRRNERERRQRISTARAHTHLSDQPEPEPEPEDQVSKRESEDSDVARKIVANVTGALGYVDGVAIVEKAQAMHITPISRGPRPLTGAEELLLADERVVYRCAKPAATVMDPKATGPCHRVFDTVTSLRGHMTFHARKTMPEGPGAIKKRKREEQLAEAAESKTRRSRAPVAPSDGASDDDQNLPVELTARLARISNFLQRLQNGIADLDKQANQVRDDLELLVSELPQHMTTTDPEVVAKAKKFDALRETLTGTIG